MAIFFDRDPFLELERLQRQMDRLFQDLTGREFYPRRVGVYPLVNISEDHDHIYVRAELPGVNPEDLEITMKDQQLVLRGERKIPPEEKNVNYHRRERESGFFRRVLRLPSPVDPNKVEARCKDGVLTITLTKPEEVKPRKITVKGE
uniref:Hsp20/alpha crystallin family protein n=1 Tax=Desulfobacca acetoxidans TaxID=60893 RepID=A0A7C3Z8J8_9BACT